MSSCSTEDGHDYVFKLLLIGASSVGKSCLLSRFTRGKFRLDPIPTTTNNIAARHVYVDSNIIEVKILDIAGNHKYRDFTTDVQMQDAMGALIVYDVTRHSTFEDVERWYSELQIANEEIEVMLIGNKSDLVKDSVTSFTEAGKAFAERVSLSFTETSAKDDKNVEKAFAELVTRIFRKVIKNVTIDAAGAPAVSPAISSEASMFRSSGKNEPAHYMLKIESFSLLSEAGTNKFESDVFEASGYKWRLELYPNGNDEDNAGNHISIYLAICHTESLPKGWEVFVDEKFYVYDHVRQNYLTFQDVDRKRARFHEKKIKWGLNKLISLDYFNNARNGCLFHDSCLFGAEVFVVSKYAEKDQCLSMIRPPAVMNSHTWTIDNFSAITEDALLSDYFKVGKVKWRLQLYPKGNGTVTEKGTYLSIYLQVYESGLLHDWCRVYAKFKISVKNQCGFADRERESDHWYKSAYGYGYPCFMLLSELGEPEKGFLLHDVLTVEAKISVVGMLNNFNWLLLRLRCVYHSRFDYIISIYQCLLLNMRAS